MREQRAHFSLARSSSGDVGPRVDQGEQPRELDRVELAAVDRLVQRLVGAGGHADAADQTLVLQLAQRLERTALAENDRHVIGVARVVDHHQLDLFEVEVLQALVDARRELVGGESLAVSELGGDDEVVGVSICLSRRALASFA